MTTLNITIPVEVLQLHAAFTKANKQCVGVGGCVRDGLLDKLPKDWDVCTDAMPDEVSKIVKSMNGWSILPIGEAFNIMAAISPTEEQYEIATFRTDGASTDGRRPDSVGTATIEEDAKRRDLTINSLYLNLVTKEVLDPSNSGGIEDLKNGIIRTVGNPINRFNEDRLRKLRVVRFALRFGFKIDNATFMAIKNDPSLQGVSKERIADEFRKMKAKSTAQIFKSCNSLGLIEEIFGKQSNFMVGLTIDNFKNINNTWCKIIAMWCVSNNVHPKNIFSRLNLTKDEKRLVEFLVSTYNLDIDIFKTIKFKKDFELLKININFTFDELSEWIDEDIFKQISNLLNSDFVKRSEERFNGLENKELGDAMELAQRATMMI